MRVAWLPNVEDTLNLPPNFELSRVPYITFTTTNTTNAAPLLLHLSGHARECVFGIPKNGDLGYLNPPKDVRSRVETHFEDACARHAKGLPVACSSKAEVVVAVIVGDLASHFELIDPQGPEYVKVVGLEHGFALGDVGPLFRCVTPHDPSRDYIGFKEFRPPDDRASCKS
ncbi:hypothetical protein VNO77_31463 [Canavalia gladiata]|uniref:Uncharacterized protein n=1 Tax=Canavalia gladiata TaxID=3824 RepID=A0AAN9KRW6_CANGL